MAYQLTDEDRQLALQEAFRQTSLPQQTSQFSSQPQQKDFWTDQISTGGGIGGALGGAALGASIGSVVPGIGTLIGGLAGGILGGGIGSGAGELAENSITGEEDLFKNVGKEALLGGIFSAPPIRLARGLSQGAKAIGTGAGREAFEQGFTGAASNATRGGVQRTSESFLGNAWGIRPGVKVGTEIITPQKASRLQQFVSREIGVPKTASAEMVFERAVNAQQETGQAIGNAIRAAGVKSYNPAQTYKSVQNRLNGVIGVDPTNNLAAQDILSLVRNAKTPEELWNVRRQIDSELINWGRNPQAATPGAEQIARAARNEISNTLAKVAPDIKNLNSRYGDLGDVIELSAVATRSPLGFTLPGFNRTVGGSTAQRIRAGAGSAAGLARGNITPSQSPVGSLGGLSARQAVGQNVVSPLSDIQPPAQTQPGLEEVLLAGSQPGTIDVQGSQSQSPYPRENLLFDIQRDPANAADYIAYFQSVNEIFGDAAQKPLSAEAAKTVSNAELGLQALGDFEGIMQSDPSVLGRTIIPGRDLLGGLGANVLGTAGIDAARAQVVDIIARLRTGAAITNDEAARFTQFLPVAADTPEVAAQKINYLRSQFQNVLTRTGNGGTDLESALLNSSSYGTL